jgi:hypothetical protein
VLVIGWYIPTTLHMPTELMHYSCNRRKIRCIGKGTDQCQKCLSAKQVCTYIAQPHKRNPMRIKNVPSLLCKNQKIKGFARTQGLLPPELVDSCFVFFFDHVYPSTPVLNRPKAQEVAANMENSTEAYCLIVTLCVYVMIQAKMRGPELDMSLCHALLEESVRARHGYEHRKNPTHVTVLTSWFYSGIYFGLAQEDTAWVHVLEAAMHARLLGMHEEATYKHDPLDTSRKRVLYWLLFISERYVCIDSSQFVTK